MHITYTLHSEQRMIINHVKFFCCLYFLMHAHLFLEIPDFNYARIQELSAGVKDQLAEKVCQRFFFLF